MKTLFTLFKNRNRIALPTLLFLFLTQFNTGLFAQIVYTDIDPDTTLIGSTSSPFHYYYMDLNHDSVDDIRFAHFAPSSSWINAEVYCVYGNNQDEMILTSSGYPLALNQGMNIGSSSGTWTNTVSGSTNSALFLNANGSGGNWIGVTNKYIGLRVMIGSNYYYGWARLDVPANAASMTIKDYAIQTTPNLAINAGDNGTVSITEENIPSYFTVYANQKTIFIYNNENEYNDVNVRVFNMLGDEVHFQNMNQSTEINMSKLNTGIYLVNLESFMGISTYKVYIQ